MILFYFKGSKSTRLKTANVSTAKVNDPKNKKKRTVPTVER